MTSKKLNLWKYRICWDILKEHDQKCLYHSRSKHLNKSHYFKNSNVCDIPFCSSVGRRIKLTSLARCPFELLFLMLNIFFFWQPCPILHMEPRMNYTPDSLLYASPLYKTSARAGVLSTTGKDSSFSYSLVYFNDLPVVLCKRTVVVIVLPWDSST